MATDGLCDCGSADRCGCECHRGRLPACWVTVVTWRLRVDDMIREVAEVERLMRYAGAVSA